MTTTQTQTQAIQVTCINLSHPNAGHEGITHLGGNNWRWTRQQVIDELESANRRYSFYTQVGGKTAWIYVRVSATGTKYVQTVADDYWNNNLLALEMCR